MQTLNPPSTFSDMLARNESLCDELVPYLQQGPVGMMLHHPLVISVVYSEHHAALFNEQYRAKSNHLIKLLNKRKFSQAIFLHERPYRFDALVEYCTDYDFHDWETIAHVWTDSENIYETIEDWKWLWSSSHPGRENAMTPEERKALRDLPTTLNIYRGISHPNKDGGMSWTIDRNKAEWFARRFGNHSRVLTGRVTRDAVYAFFLGRGESEVVVDPEYITIVDEIAC